MTSRAATPAGRFLGAGDGDTVEVAFKIRLAGIISDDGTELDKKAKARIEELLEPGKARVTVWWAVGETSYRRLTAKIEDKDGNDIGQILVDEGLVRKVFPRPLLEEPENHPVS